MREAIQVLQFVLELGAACCVGFLAGLGLGHAYLEVVRGRGSDAIRATYWLFVRRAFWLSQYVGWALVAWLLLEGSALLAVVAAMLGLIVGNFVALAGASVARWMRKGLGLGLVLCGLDGLFQVFADGWGALVGALAWGLAIALGVGVITAIVAMVTRRLGSRAGVWAFRLSAWASLLLTSGHPLLWLVLAASVGYGFSYSARCVPHQSNESPARLIVLGLGVVAIGHALFTFYFYQMPSYGRFWRPSIAVAPYALGAFALGLFGQRIRWPSAGGKTA